MARPSKKAAGTIVALGRITLTRKAAFTATIFLSKPKKAANGLAVTNFISKRSFLARAYSMPHKKPVLLRLWHTTPLAWIDQKTIVTESI